LTNYFYFILFTVTPSQVSSGYHGNLKKKVTPGFCPPDFHVCVGISERLAAYIRCCPFTLLQGANFFTLLELFLYVWISVEQISRFSRYSPRISKLTFNGCHWERYPVWYPKCFISFIVISENYAKYKDVDMWSKYQI